MRSRSRTILAATVALGCLTLSHMGTWAEDAPAASHAPATPEQEKEELLADLKQLVIGNNMEDASFLESLFKVHFTPVMYSCHPGCTSVGFRADRNPNGFGIDYEIALEAPGTPQSHQPGARLIIHVDPRVCVSLTDLSWWSDKLPEAAVVLDGGGPEKTYNFLRRDTDEMHSISMQAQFSEKGCLFYSVIFQNYVPKN